MAIETTEKVSTLIRRGAEIAHQRKIKNSFIDFGSTREGVCGVCGNGAAGLGLFADHIGEWSLAELQSNIVLDHPARNVDIPPEINAWVSAVRKNAGWDVEASDYKFDLSSLIVVLNDLTDMSLLEIADFLEAIGY